MTANLERASEHPLAAAVVSHAEELGLEVRNATSFELLTGNGVIGEVEGRRVVVENRKLMDDLGIEPGELATRAEELHADDQTVMFVCC